MASSMTTASGMTLKVNMNVDSTQAKREFNTAMQYMGQKSQIRLTIDGTDFTKTVRTYQDQMGNLYETTTLWNHQLGKGSTELTGITSAMERFNNAESRAVSTTNQINTAQSNLNNTVSRGTSVFRSFTDTFLKMVKFNTINLIYDAIASSLGNCVKITNEFNSAMIEFKKVTDTSNLSLTQYVETLDKLGETVGFSRTEMLEAATEYSKAGFDADTAAQLARVSSLYRNIADEELSAGDAASYVVSQLKAFNMETDNVAETTKNAMSIIDKTNEV